MTTIETSGKCVVCKTIVSGGNIAGTTSNDGSVCWNCVDEYDNCIDTLVEIRADLAETRNNIYWLRQDPQPGHKYANNLNALLNDAVHLETELKKYERWGKL